MGKTVASSHTGPARWPCRSVSRAPAGLRLSWARLPLDRPAWTEARILLHRLCGLCSQTRSPVPAVPSEQPRSLLGARGAGPASVAVDLVSLKVVTGSLQGAGSGWLT